MEYVVLLGLIVLPLVLGNRVLFNPAGDYRGEFGLVGDAYHDFYANLVMGISQPTP